MKTDPPAPRVVFRTEWFEVEEMASQPHWCMGAKPFYRINGPDGALVLPVTDDHRIVMVRQYRPARGKFTLEIPAGGIGPGETPAEVAARELLEETGFVASELVFLGRSGLNVNRESAYQHAFAALGARPSPGRVPESGLEVQLVTPDEFARIAGSAEFDQLAALGVMALAQLKLGPRVPKVI